MVHQQTYVKFRPSFLPGFPTAILYSQKKREETLPEMLNPPFFNWFLAGFSKTLIFCFVYRYQNELPKRIKQRGKDAHLVHEELVKAMKWKQTVSSKTVLYEIILIFVFHFFFFVVVLAWQILSAIVLFDKGQHTEGRYAGNEKSIP